MLGVGMLLKVEKSLKKLELGPGEGFHNSSFESPRMRAMPRYR